MINKINCSLLESPSTSADDETNNGDSKSTLLEPTIQNLMKETRLFRRESRNLVRRGNNTRPEISQIEKITLKAMRGCSINNTITNQLR